MTLTLLPLVAVSLSELIALFENRKLRINKPYISPLVCTVFLLYPAYAIYLQSFHFNKAPIPKVDISQYYSNQGFYMRQMTSYLNTAAENKHITLFVQDSWHAQAVDLFLSTNPNIEIHDSVRLEKGIPPVIRKTAQKNATYLLTLRDRKENYLKLHQFSIPPGDFQLYQVLP